MKTNTVYITRVAEFCIAHRVYKPEWSDEKNLEVFGKCAHPNYHGHNLIIEVTVKGTPDPETGFVMNFSELKKIIKEVIEDPIDHKNLNIDVPFMKGVIPTMENLVLKIWEELKPHIKPPAELYKIRIHETGKNVVEYFGE